MPRRQRRRETGGRDAGVPGVMPFRQLTLPDAPIEILSADQIEEIHVASLRVMAETGMRVLSAEARGILAQAGAMVDGEGQVHFDPALVEETVAQAPSEFLLEARDPNKSIRIGGRHAMFSSVGGPAFVSDLDHGRRPGTYAEQCDYLRLVQTLGILHQEGGGPFEAMDLPAPSRHLDLYLAQCTLIDKNWHPWGLGRVRARDALEMAAIALGCTREDLTDRVVFTCVINTNSPMVLDTPMAEGLIEMAAHGQAVVITPFTLAGAMSPITLAGTLVQQNAEALAGIVLAQSVRPGAPVMYGSFATNVDMRTGSPAFGTPEYVQAAQISGRLARRYRVPFRSSNATGANSCDAQAAYESQMSLWGAIMGHAHMLNHGAGWLSGGLTASFEKLILDAEMLQMMAHYLTPPPVDRASLGVEAIAAAGAGNHFFGADHTLARYQTAFYEPLVSSWETHEAWLEGGSQTAEQRANAVWKRLLATYEKPPIDPATEEALVDYVARRTQRIADGTGLADG